MSDLTGNTRYRSHRGKLILQVQYTKQSPLGFKWIHPWRDATMEDITVNLPVALDHIAIGKPAK